LCEIRAVRVIAQYTVKNDHEIGRSNTTNATL